MQFDYIIDYLFQMFIPLLITMTVLVVIFGILIIRVRTAKIGDTVLVFDDNTIQEFKGKKFDKALSFDKHTVKKDYTPRLWKRGFYTDRVYLIEEGGAKTTDLHSYVLKKKKDTTQTDDMDQAVKEQILRSGILDRFLAVFKNIGFSWESFAMGLFLGTTIVFAFVSFGVFG